MSTKLVLDINPKSLKILKWLSEAVKRRRKKQWPKEKNTETNNDRRITTHNTHTHTH